MFVHSLWARRPRHGFVTRCSVPAGRVDHARDRPVMGLGGQILDQFAVVEQRDDRRPGRHPGQRPVVGAAAAPEAHAAPVDRQRRHEHDGGRADRVEPEPVAGRFGEPGTGNESGHRRGPSPGRDRSRSTGQEDVEAGAEQGRQQERPARFADHGSVGAQRPGPAGREVARRLGDRTVGPVPVGRRMARRRCSAARRRFGLDMLRPGPRPFRWYAVGQDSMAGRGRQRGPR